jgi:hypothetical protein
MALLIGGVGKGKCALKDANTPKGSGCWPSSARTNVGTPLALWTSTIGVLWTSTTQKSAIHSSDGEGQNNFNNLHRKRKSCSGFFLAQAMSLQSRKLAAN